ncbi:MAG: hypothetical protein HY719_15625 [Planctomycetes bacterium]|nr:hypothetical protein [Planctomycetota bacterium]
MRSFLPIGLLVAAASASAANAEERTQHFDQDPAWEGRNNRAAATAEPRRVVQDFGFSPTNHAGGKAAGEMGGTITPDAEPAWYARKITPKSLADPLSASGVFASPGDPFHVLLGFFNADTLNEWRTPNTIALRLSGRGDVVFAWLEYGTSRWRAGADSPKSFPTVKDEATGRSGLKGFAAKGVSHRWSLRYDPEANEGRGALFASIDDATAVCHLEAGHKSDGATFNHFGLMTVMKSADSSGTLWLDDVTVNGEPEEFAKDPGWEGFQNRRTHACANVRPRGDFGFSPTRHAGGQAAGELGGVIFRGDIRYPERMACYGDRIETLSLAKPLRASGKVALRRGVSDSGVLLGFYNSKASLATTDSQASGVPKHFLGVQIEGPSAEGFFLYPLYRVESGDQGVADPRTGGRILPDGAPHDFALAYDPAGAESKGRILVTVDKQEVTLEIAADHRRSGAAFDRFGVVTTWIDGNAQHVFFDDLTYTCRQE